jgi:hypothetical protein
MGNRFLRRILHIFVRYLLYTQGVAAYGNTPVLEALSLQAEKNSNEGRTLACSLPTGTVIGSQVEHR